MIILVDQMRWSLIYFFCFCLLVASGKRCREMDTKMRCAKFRRCQRILPKLEKKCVRLYGHGFRAKLNHKSDKYLTKMESKGRLDQGYGIMHDMPLPKNRHNENAVTFGAKIDAVPVNVTVPPGATAEFTCITSGAPAPQTTVTRVDKNREEGSFLKSRISYNLSQIQVINIIEEVTHADEGWYRCSTMNAYGGATADAYLEVRDLCAEVKCPSPQKNCVANYTSLTTSCECPTCHMSELSYQPVCGTDCKEYFSSCFMKQYTCKQNNGYVIDVLYERKCPEFTKLSAVIPGPLGQRYYYTGEKIELECLVDGSPSPTILWYKYYSEGNMLYIDKGPRLVFNKALLDDTANYVCVAENCINKSVRSSPVKIKVEDQYQALRETTEFGSKICHVFGNGHVTTFDGFAYDFSGICDYVLALDCMNGSWLIYGKMVNCGGAHCLESVSLYYGRDVVILARGWVVSHRGVKVKLSEGTDIQAGAISLYYDGLYITATLEDEVGTLRLIWDGISSTYITLTDGYSTYTCGLCGNMDNNPSNLINSDVPHLDSSVSNITEFLKSWRADRLGRCLNHKAKKCSKEDLETAEKHCRKIFGYSKFRKCKRRANSDDYFFACVQDSCRGNFLQAHFSVPCQIGTDYLKRCDLEGFAVPDSLFEVGCPSTRLIQPLALSIGCPQLTSPFNN